MNSWSYAFCYKHGVKHTILLTAVPLLCFLPSALLGGVCSCCWLCACSFRRELAVPCCPFRRCKREGKRSSLEKTGLARNAARASGQLEETSRSQSVRSLCGFLTHKKHYGKGYYKSKQTKFYIELGHDNVPRRVLWPASLSPQLMKVLKTGISITKF